MSNVFPLQRRPDPAIRPAAPALVQMLASGRRTRHDPFWLKENAELVQILAATETTGTDLSPLSDAVADLPREMRFFPQYYRLYLSLAVDLAALGVPGLAVADMAAFVRDEALAEVELSDTHRAEARLLMRRAGLDLGADPGLEERLHRFATNARAFCVPNRRAAYDLTHIVFHASDYGRSRLARDADRRLSLIHAGMIAWLEDNLDLLAEVVIALRLSGEDAPSLWAATVCRGARDVEFLPAGRGVRLEDDCHQYLVANWAASILGQGLFLDGVPADASVVRQSRPPGPALRELSLALLDMGDGRSGDWARMRWRLWSKLAEPSRNRLSAIEAMPEFEGFFEGFARAEKMGEKA